MPYGQKIADLRKKSGMTQNDLAEKLYVSRELVSKWETGKRIPDCETAKKISELFDIPVNELSGTDNKIYDEITVCLPKNREIPKERLTEIINSFLNTLPVTERTIFISRYYYGKSSEQTSSELGLGSGYIRKKLTVIRKKLTQFAKENFYE